MNAILKNPEIMQKIFSMAQTMSPEASSNPANATETNATFPEIDSAMIEKITGLAGKANIDNNQRSLLSALKPYLSRDRIAKLERAMRAAKMAGMASAFLGSSSR